MFRKRTFVVAALIAALLSSRVPAALRGIAGSSSGGGSPLATQPSIANQSGGALPANWSWSIGLPIKGGALPSGQHLTATIGGTPVTVCAEQVKQEADGSAAWMKLLINGSGISIANGSSAALVLTPAAGGWSTTTTRTNADWEALNDTVEITNLTTTGTAAADMASGNLWLAKFDGGATNTIETIGTSPCGLDVWVTATFVDQTTSTTHAYLQAQMEYWVTQNGSSLGAIASRGPFIANTQVFKKTLGGINNPSQFGYNLAFKRNGTTVRSETGVSHPTFAYEILPRIDGQWDWTASDPGLRVDWDYTKVRKTLKIPTYVDGIVYTGLNGYAQINESLSSINATSGVLTFTPTVNDLVSSHNNTNWPVSVDFTGTSLPSSISSGMIYWLVKQSTTTATIYNNLANALAAAAPGTCPSSTGQICPGSTFTSVAARLSVAPTSPGAFSLALAAASTRPDISLTTEWGAAYLLAATSATPDGFQRLGRVMADAEASEPDWAINDKPGPDGFQHIPCMLSAGQTDASANCPAGLIGTGQTGTTFTSSSWAPPNQCSSDIEGGSCSSAGTTASLWNQWTQGSGINRAHQPNAIYPVWLLTGDEFRRRLLILNGNGAIAYSNNFSPLNIQGTNYYTARSYMGYPVATTLRVAVWANRDKTMAAFAATQGSPEETYFRDALTQGSEALAVYNNYKGATYTADGVDYFDDQIDTQTTTLSSSLSAFGIDNFMTGYDVVERNFACMLQGNFISGTTAGISYGLCNDADFVTRGTVGKYANCGYNATTAFVDISRNDVGGPSPGLYSTLPDLAYLSDGNNNQFTINTDGSVTQTNGWGSLFTPLVGDKWRPYDYDEPNNVARTPAVAPFADGTDYTIATINSSTHTMTFSGISSGPASPVTGVGGGYVLSQTNATACPATGSISGAGGQGDTYVSYDAGGMALSLAAGRSVSGAATQYTNASGRQNGLWPSGYDTIAMWAFQPTP